MPCYIALKKEKEKEHERRSTTDHPLKMIEKIQAATPDGRRWAGSSTEHNNEKFCGDPATCSSSSLLPSSNTSEQAFEKALKFVMLRLHCYTETTKQACGKTTWMQTSAVGVQHSLCRQVRFGQAETAFVAVGGQQGSKRAVQAVSRRQMTAGICVVKASNDPAQHQSKRLNQAQKLARVRCSPGMLEMLSSRLTLNQLQVSAKLGIDTDASEPW